VYQATILVVIRLGQEGFCFLEVFERNREAIELCFVGHGAP
jgi:hypothetical protein